MSEHSKEYSDLTEMLAAAQIMSNFQSIHNLIRLEFLLILNIAEENKHDKQKFDALYRVCLIRFFTLIEADVYSLNQLDMYSGYDDKQDRFIQKFKDTYKQVCTTWNKKELQKKYFDTKLQLLQELKVKRDELVHPKRTEHIHSANEEEFQKLTSAFNDYDSFVNDLMNGFYLSSKISLL